MTTQTETQDNSLDPVKLLAALALLICALAGFYWFDDQSLLLRVIGLLVVAGISVAIALQTERGRDIHAFFKSAQVEVRKVVWPTKKETWQTTLIVMLMVFLVAVFMWILDWALGALVKMLMGMGA